MKEALMDLPEGCDYDSYTLVRTLSISDLWSCLALS
jgi:hypothetical protein